MNAKHIPAVVALGIIIILSCRTADVLGPQPTLELPVHLPTAGVAQAIPTLLQVIVSTIAPSSSSAIASPTIQTATPAQPPATRPLTCTDPNASITDPMMDSTISGLIEIDGTATRSNNAVLEGRVPPRVEHKLSRVE